MAWSPLQEIVTLDQFKAHVKLPADVVSEDDDLTLKLLIAHEMVFDYLTQRVDEDNLEEWTATVDAWTAETAPKRVLGAILAQAAFLYRRRGDDNDRVPTVEGAAICQDAEMLLKRFRDPAVA